jgi:hypothetical protein
VWPINVPTFVLSLLRGTKPAVTKDAVTEAPARPASRGKVLNQQLAAGVLNGSIDIDSSWMQNHAGMLRLTHQSPGPWLELELDNAPRVLDYNLGLRRELIRPIFFPFTFLRVQNHTLEPDGSRKEYWLTTPRSCVTPHDAVAWSFGVNPNAYKEAVAS